MKTTTIQIATNGPDGKKFEPLEIPTSYILTPDLCVHRSIPGAPGNWSITHIHTGFRLTCRWTLKQCREVVAAIKDQIDWSFTEPSVLGRGTNGDLATLVRHTAPD